MLVRKKGNSVRVSFTEANAPPSDLDYVLIEPAQCWCSTFKSWGKQIDQPIIELGGTLYRVSLEKV